MKGIGAEALSSSLDLVRKLEEELKLQLPGAAQKQREAVEAWTREEEDKDKKERQFQSLLAELHHRIQQSEEKDTSARYVETPEMRDDYEGMHRVWRALADFTRSIPEATTALFRKRSALLEGEIARRTAIRRRLIVAVSVAILTIGASGSGFPGAGTYRKTRDFARRLQEAVAQRQVRMPPSKLLDEAHSEKMGDAATVAAAETFATKEHGLLANFEAAFNRLPPQLGGEPTAVRLAGIADQLITDA